MNDYQLVPYFVYTKAQKLLMMKAVTLFRKNVAVVEGFNSDHYVKFEENGRVVCDCKAFEEHGVCSHSVAYVLFDEERARG